jgi:hypothetical protein
MSAEEEHETEPESDVEADVQEAGPDEKYCSECGSIISEKAEVCPECGVRVDGQPEADAELTAQQQKYMKVALAVGGVFCAIALIFLPIVFAPLAFLLGVIVALKYDSQNGIILIAASLVCGFIGVAFGFLVALLF